ncbi:MAG: hypothetical protein ACYDIA_12045 [Candidatus Humimicrobiaceae bacterium]
MFTFWIGEFIANIVYIDAAITTRRITNNAPLGLVFLIILLILVIALPIAVAIDIASGLSS